MDRERIDIRSGVLDFLGTAVVRRRRGDKNATITWFAVRRTLTIPDTVVSDVMKVPSLRSCSTC